MLEDIISLKPSMKKQLGFDHPLMDKVKLYKLPRKQVEEVLARYLEHRHSDDAEILILSHQWIVHEFVCRFRAYFCEVWEMTDDLVGVGLTALSEYVQEKLHEPISQLKCFRKMRAFIHERMKDYINDNISAFSASRETNKRRLKAEQPLEYNFAIELNDEIVGEIDEPYLIDILDSIEALNEVDAEEMRDLVLKFLKQNHNISEEELTPEERASLEKLTELVRNAGV